VSMQCVHHVLRRETQELSMHTRQAVTLLREAEAAAQTARDK
jgi:hypothetical protein